MSGRRRFSEDQPHAVARRTSGQWCRLTPTLRANRLVRYLLLLNCQRHAEELEVTAYCALSNHHHLIVTDLEGGPDSKVPVFFRDFHAKLAKCLNDIHGRSGVVWDPSRSFSDVEIHGFDAEIAQWVYVAGQAVAAGLVERPEDWPGVCWLPEDIGRTLTARRPPEIPPDDPDELTARHLDRARRKSQDDKKRGRSARRRKQLARERENRARASLPAPGPDRPDPRYPAEVSYTVPIPKCLRGRPLEAARAYLRLALDDYVERIHEERRALGLGFLGPEALEDQDPLAPPPKTHVDEEHPATYERCPRLATHGLDKDAVRELRDDLSAWEAAYDVALEILRSPLPHRARFPDGAHLRAQEMRRVLAAYSAQAPPQAA